MYVYKPVGPRDAQVCGAGSGLFLLTSSSAVLLVREKRIMVLARTTPAANTTPLMRLRYQDSIKTNQH